MDADMAVALQQSDLLMRLRAVLLSPKRAWSFIALEAADPVGLYFRIVLPLAAIPPLAKLLSWSLFFGFISFGTAAAAAGLAWALSAAGVAIIAWAAARLARFFGGEERFGQALKLIAYSATASWLGGVFRLVPILAILSPLCSLYSVFLVYRGAPALLEIPPERAALYALAVAGVALAVYIASAALVAGLLGIGAWGMA